MRVETAVMRQATLSSLSQCLNLPLVRCSLSVRHYCSYAGGRRPTCRRSQPPLALAVPLSRFAPRVGGGSACYVGVFSPTPMLPDYSTYTNAEIERWIHLRAIEWSG